MDQTETYKILLEMKGTLGGLVEGVETIKTNMQSGDTRMTNLEIAQSNMKKDVAFAKGKTMGMSLVLSSIVSIIGTWWMGHGK